MVNIEHTPIKSKCGDFNNHYTITGNSISEIVDFCLPRIRDISKEFYKKNIKNDLQDNSETIIDVHAGMGQFYSIKLINNEA
jgi:hypothetical protein